MELDVQKLIAHYEAIIRELVIKLSLATTETSAASEDNAGQ